MALEVRSGVIIGTSGWYSKEAAQGKIIDVLIDPNRNDYPLAVTPSNDALFTSLDGVRYKNGRAPGGNYSNCWVNKQHISFDILLYKNNRGASKLLLQEEEQL